MLVGSESITSYTGSYENVRTSTQRWPQSTPIRWIYTPLINSHRWQLDRRHEHIEDPGLFYAFVDLGWDFGNDFDVEKPKKNPLRIKDPPEVFIVPSERVARAVRVSHQAWRSILKKDGTPRKDGNQRDIFDTYPPRFGEVEGFPAGWMQPYRNNWGLRQ
jgi:hypothetical protein